MRGVRLSLLWTLGLLAAVCLAVSCGTATFIVQQYPGPARSAETIAVLRVDGSGTVQLLSLDGEATDVPVSSDARLHIELLPGLHRLAVQSLTGEGTAHFVTFRAEAGKVYRVEFMAGAMGPSAPHVYEVDRGSNALKADVTAVESPPAAAQPARAAAKAPVIVERATPESQSADAGAPQ